MEIWLGANMTTFERIMIHAMLHDPTHRTMLTGAGLTHNEFMDVKAGLLFAAICLGATTYEQMGQEFPAKPSALFLISNVTAVNREEAIATPEELADTLAMGNELLDPELHQAEWHAVSSYFEGWMGTSLMRKMARKVYGAKVVNPGTVAHMFQATANRAASVYTGETDDLDDAMTDTSEDMIDRYSTGFDQLDAAIGGGMAGGECGVIVGGTKAGKSTLVAQIGAYQIGIQVPVLTISTEMPAVIYLARMVSNRCTINISKFNNCRNWHQIVMVVASTDSSKLAKLEQLKAEIDQYYGFKKLDPDIMSGVRGVLDNALIRFEKKRGCPPAIIFFDWMGRMVNDTKAVSSSDRSAVWERSADEYAKFAEKSGASLVILAQAVNDSNRHMMLGVEHIAVGKGIVKPMTWAVMLTNFIDKAAFRDSQTGNADAVTTTIANKQFLCPAAARKAASSPPIEITRSKLMYQRFEAAPPL